MDVDGNLKLEHRPDRVLNVGIRASGCIWINTSILGIYLLLTTCRQRR